LIADFLPSSPGAISDEKYKHIGVKREMLW
jgi:hypothetical protein